LGIVQVVALYEIVYSPRTVEYFSDFSLNRLLTFIAILQIIRIFFKLLKEFIDLVFPISAIETTIIIKCLINTTAKSICSVFNATYKIFNLFAKLLPSLIARLIATLIAIAILIPTLSIGCCD
jgi:hypothetical protein